MRAEYIKVEGDKKNILFSIEFWTDWYDWSIPPYDEDEETEEDIIDWFNDNSIADGIVKDEYPELWNIATDGVINQFLKRDGLKIPQGGVDIAEAINYDAEQLYEKLLQGKQQSGQGNRQQNSGGSQDENNHQQSQSQQQCNSDSGSSKEQENQSQEHSCGESGKCVQKEDKSKQDVGSCDFSLGNLSVAGIEVIDVIPESDSEIS